VLQSFVVYMVFCPPLFPLLSWSSCVSVAQSFVVYIVFCPSLFSPFFPGHRVFGVAQSFVVYMVWTEHHIDNKRLDNTKTR
jgi:hypothetical protein